MRLVSLIALAVCPRPAAAFAQDDPAPAPASMSRRTMSITITMTRSWSRAFVAAPVTCSAACRCSIRRASQGTAPEPGRDLGAATGRIRDQLRPGRLATDPARPVGRPHPRPDRRHWQLRRLRLSPDHAVAISPLTAERIGVLRGPSALLYGSSAIGGVVNVIDRRIPREEPEGGLDVNGLLEWNRGRGTLGQPFRGWRACRPFRHPRRRQLVKSDDLRTGGHLLTKELREEAAASPFSEIQELAELKGELPPRPRAGNWLAAWPMSMGRSTSACR